MLEQLRQIDTSVIEELMTIKSEREIVAARLDRMEGERGEVSDVVYRRVRRDYESKAGELERQAAPLKDRARQEYVKLKALLDRLEAQHDATRLDREEIDFRQRLGEFTTEEYEQRVSDLDGRLAGQEDDLATASEVRRRFLDAFDSEADLTAPVEAAPPSPPAATPVPGGEAPIVEPAEVSAMTATAVEPVPPPVAVPPQEAAPDDGTVILPPEAPGPVVQAAPAAASEAAAPATLETTGGRTIILNLAKLVAIDPDLGAAEFQLEPLSFIGRTPANQVHLDKPAVSRRHAQIALCDEGWVLKDLQSENGSYVNGERVIERLLADGDHVQIGTVRLIFRVS